MRKRVALIIGLDEHRPSKSYLSNRLVCGIKSAYKNFLVLGFSLTPGGGGTSLNSRADMFHRISMFSIPGSISFAFEL